MELTKVLIWGYKRFAERHALNLEGKVIAIVGPNEAGKTSLLEALEHLNEGADFDPAEESRDAADDTGVQAHYALDDADRRALRGLREAASARELIVWKRGTYELQFKLDCKVTRNLKPRQQNLARLHRLQASHWAQEQPGDSELISVLNQSAVDLDRDDQNLDAEQLARLQLLASQLQRVDDLPNNCAKLAEQLGVLAEGEEQDHPLATAREVLDERRPKFLLLKEEDRLLHPTYDFDGDTNAALHNVLSLSGVSWQDFRSAYGTQDRGGRLEELEEIANKQLKKEFSRAWSQRQTPLTVRLRIDGSTLQILIPRYGTGYVSITERSDGLRQFIALRGFLKARGITAPVLLVDEAERHLHYDAQADLVQVLTEQADAPKVIYSTHSAGCLPQDLGTGVRIVVPAEHTNVSKIENWFWQLGLGLSPILLGMGASALAFASARKAVIGEGITEAILLPSLLREATSESALDYQVAPGLAEAGRATFDELDLTAARVAYLVDGDAGSLAKKQTLRDEKVPARLIIVLGAGKQPLTTEDLIHPDTFVQAVNHELATTTSARMEAPDLTAVQRFKSVEAWCAKQNPVIRTPSKRAIAARVVEARSQGKPLSDPRHQRTLAKLHKDIEKALAPPAHSRRTRGSAGATSARDAK